MTLGLAISANAAIFAVFRVLLLQPLPCADADRLVMLGERWPNLIGVRPVSMLNEVDWTQQRVAAGGAVCGGLIGYGALKSVTNIIPTIGLRAAVPPDTVIEMDTTVWLFTLGLAACSGIAFGLAPALGATRVSVASVIAGDGHAGVNSGPAQQRSRTILVGVEVALAFVLLTSAVLLTQSLFTLTNRVVSGFDSSKCRERRLANVAFSIRSQRRRQRAARRTGHRLQILPGIGEVAFTDALPTHGAPLSSAGARLS